MTATTMMRVRFVSPVSIRRSGTAIVSGIVPQRGTKSTNRALSTWTQSLTACGAPTRYREVVLTVSKLDFQKHKSRYRLGHSQYHLAVAGGCAAGSAF